MITYGLVQSQVQLLISKTPEHVEKNAKGIVLEPVRNPMRWDYVILDEGHKIRNPSQTTRNMQLLKANGRLIITGTPVQNRVEDLWQLMNWATCGQLLGKKKPFMDKIGTPIIKAREKNCGPRVAQRGIECSKKLKET